MHTKSIFANGQHSANRREKSHPTSRAPVPDPSEMSTNGFSLNDLMSTQPTLQQKFPTLLLGAGTTGVSVMRNVEERLATALQFRNPELPYSRPLGFDFQGFDTDTAGASRRKGDVFAISPITAGNVGSSSASGVGTVSAEGRKMIRDLAVWRAVGTIIKTKVSKLRADDATLPCATNPAAGTDVMIVAGPGGTGGGIQDDLILMARDAATDCNVNVRVHLLLIGPEIAIKDVSRQVSPNQARTIRATIASLLYHYADDFVGDGYRTESRADGTAFAIQRADRIWGLTFADRFNGIVTCPTVDDLVDILSEALFLQIFTHAGAHYDSRYIDFVGTKDDGRGQWR